jgi:hypothetical protein
MAENENMHVVHHLEEVSEKVKEETSEKLREEGHRHPVIIEFGEAALLALVAILTAWSGYQAARWDGHNALYYGEANKDRVLATQASTMGGQYQLYDATTLNNWLQATTEHNATLAAFYERRFSPPFKVAFDAWLKTDPFHNPKAPLGPSFMPQYHNPYFAQANALNNQASATFEQGTSARETADEYVRATVLLATVLFLVALSQRFQRLAARAGLLVVGSAILLIVAAQVATYAIA